MQDFKAQNGLDLTALCIVRASLGLTEVKESGETMAA